MTKQEMFNFILEAHRKGIPGCKIEPSRKGTTLTRLKNNPESLNKISERKIKEMYDNAKLALENATQNNVTPKDTKVTQNNVVLCNTNNTQKDTEVVSHDTKVTQCDINATQNDNTKVTPNNTKTETQNVTQIVLDDTKVTQCDTKVTQNDTQNEIAKLKEEVKRLNQKNQELKIRIEALEKEKSLHKIEHKPKHKIMGFNIREQLKISNRRRYWKWQATKSLVIGDKRRTINIYVGEDPSLAEEKIKAYLERNPEIKTHIEKV